MINFKWHRDNLKLAVIKVEFEVNRYHLHSVVLDMLQTNEPGTSPHRKITRATVESALRLELQQRGEGIDYIWDNLPGEGSKMYAEAETLAKVLFPEAW